jgi:hypothetical protein
MEMIAANKTYGFTIAVKELKETVPNIFRYASAYKRNNNLVSKGLWEMFVEHPPEDQKKSLPEDDPKFKRPLPEEILQTDPGHSALPEVDPENMEGEKYNMCHFWSNFEIARLDWFRSKEYEDFFNTMDRSGGFWTERVRGLLAQRGYVMLTGHSGEMPLFTRWPQELSWRREISITSEISDTDTQPFSIVPQTHRLGNSLENHSWKRRRRTRRRGKRRMNTGLRRIR